MQRGIRPGVCQGQSSVCSDFVRMRNFRVQGVAGREEKVGWGFTTTPHETHPIPGSEEGTGRGGIEGREG